MYRLLLPYSDASRKYVLPKRRTSRCDRGESLLGIEAQLQTLEVHDHRLIRSDQDEDQSPLHHRPSSFSKLRKTTWASSLVASSALLCTPSISRSPLVAPSSVSSKAYPRRFIQALNSPYLHRIPDC